jgi:Lrp/AsnC family transcriptional regulator, leucine-responsive regulatory protein
MGVLLKDWWHMPHRTLPNVLVLDKIAWKILEALQQNARLSFAELGRKIGLSTPAVAERVHRLEEAGIITGYHAALDMAKLGVPIRVLVRLTIHGGDLQVQRTVAAVKELAEISRCHRITGAESFVIEANVISIRHLEVLIDKLSALGATSTSTVLSSPVEGREYHGGEIEAFCRYL